MTAADDLRQYARALADETKRANTAERRIAAALACHVLADPYPIGNAKRYCICNWRWDKARGICTSPTVAALTAETGTL